MARVADGDETALGRLHDRHASLLTALVRRMISDPSDAEDIVQEAFLQVWHQAPRYDRSKASVPTWLVLIARSRAIDRLRSERVKSRTLNDFGQQRGATHTSPEGARTVLEEQRRSRLRNELGKLPDEQRQVLELAFFNGLTQSQIAGSTGIPLGTVKTRTLLAMKKLRAALTDEIRDFL
ncbi:MAG: sigma-70 family RNA polymerase sigma factor [Acidobacteriota bacterium]